MNLGHEQNASVAEPAKLVLLNDSPAGADGPSSVAFSHDLYADLLRDVLRNNRPGICVGFFARWGQGKSTVINLLKKAFADKANVVIFNAYQARGDSVRRQMLLSILRQIDPKKAEEFERFNQTITPLEFATTEEQERYSNRNLVKLLFLERKLDPFLVISAVVAIGCSGVFVYNVWQVLIGKTTFADSHDLVLWLFGIVVACTTFIVRKFQERKTSLLAYTQPASDSQRLKYPEQFAKVFTNSVIKYCGDSGKRLIIVVDDLDRCEPGTVVEALASVRQFCHGATGSPIDCQFLIPCDEGQMVSALEADGYALTTKHKQYHNYSEAEMLRKFFDVVVRMDEIVPESLADFAAEEATKISISPELARDIVDAAAIREPRKVKSLLNALRVAQETVARSQARGLLPDPKHMERFEHTLAMMVCFQELAPVAFAEVKENADILLQPELPSDKNIEAVAHRIFSSFGSVSATTADVLITKQNEPSLRGLPQAHSLPAAVRADRGEEVVKIFIESDDKQLPRLLGWLGRKLRDARSSVRIRQLLCYILDFGKANDWKSPLLQQFVSILNKQRPFLPEALRLGNRLESWGVYCNTISSADRHIFDRVVLKTYLSEQESQPDEERFVLRYADKLTPGEAQSLRSSIKSGLFPNQSILVSVNRLKQISENLPQEMEVGCYGFYPEIGEQLFKLLDDPRNPIGVDLHESCLRVGLCFIGSNHHTANAVLTEVLERVSFFQTPQDLSPQFLKDKGVYFGLLRGLLASQSKFERFQAFFNSRYQVWLSKQAHPHGRLKFLFYIQPGWGFLTEQSLTGIGKIVAPWFWDDEQFAKEAVATIDTPLRQDESWLNGRATLRKSIFADFCDVARDKATLSSAAKRFFASVQTATWDFRELAENLLSEKARRLNPSAANRPNNINEWFEALKPLCDQNLQKLAKTVRDTLTNNNGPQELIEFALRSIWGDTIPDDCAAPLADTLIRYPALTLANDTLGSKIIARSGFSEIARILLTQLKSHNAEWMHNNKSFMMRLSEFAATDSKLSARFQAVIDALLTANRDEYFVTGLQLLTKHEKIIADVRSSLNAWHKGKSETDQNVKLAIEISLRPEF